MLSIRNLSVSIDNKPILSDVSFDIGQQEIVALCGESGSGKTITALSILRLLKKTRYNSGEILWLGKNLLTKTEKELCQIRGKDIGYIFQEPNAALNPTKTIGQQVGEVFTLHYAYTKQEVIAKTKKVLDQAGYSNADLNRYPHQLSGGQKQRVLIAIALALKPKLIIADEPTTALDRHLQLQIIALFKTLKNQISVLMITHDLSLVKELAHRIIIMKDGQTIESGDVHAVLTSPKHAYTKKLIQAEPPGKPISLQGSKSKTILSVSYMNYSISNGLFWKKESTHILKNVSFHLSQGKTLGIIGESGSGKTTIAKLIVRLSRLSSGSILYKNRVINNLSYRDFLPLRKKIQYIFQDPYSSLNPRMKIREIFTEGLLAHKKAIDEDVLHSILEQVSLPVDTLDRFPNEFSGGQRQRIAIARALLLEPEILILDEPTSALDRTVQKNILLLLKKIQKEKGLSYLFISHDLSVVRSICHDIVVLKDGKVVEQGSTEQVFSSPQNSYTKLLLTF